jgi:1,2-diacylglycerol 3-alpha-glucosyltransferase
MRIAIFSDTLFPQINGVAYTAYQSAEFLFKAGHQVIVVTAMTKENRDRLRGKHEFEVVFSASIPTGIYPGERMAIPFDPKAFLRIKKFKPEIIHTHTPFSVGWSAVFVSKILNVPLVGTNHTFFDHYLKHVKLDHAIGKKISWQYTTLYYNFCDLVLCPSESIAEHSIQNGLKKPTRIFRNAIDTNFFTPPTIDKKNELKNKLGLEDFSIVYVGRLSYEKSVDVVLRAFAQASKNIFKISFYIGGDGPEKKKLEKLSYELGISHQTKFVGFVRDQEWLEAFQSADLFITASKSENMPLTIVEAMSTGLPIVAVDSKGIPEIVQNGANGFLSDPDDTNSMANNIIKLESDKNLRGAMSLASRELALEYSYERIGGKLIEVYTDVIKRTI